MSLPTLAVRRPVTTAMILLSILVVGGIAIGRLPLAYLPELDVPFILVEVPYPSSNPAQVEKDVVKPIEEALSTLSGIKKINAEATADGAQVFLQFDWGEELDVVRMKVSEKIDAIKGRLPAGVGDVVILSFNTNDIPVVEGRISAKGVDLSENYDLLETRILNRLRRIPGVARVTLEGVAPKEISIDLVLDEIKAHSVDVGALIRRLQGASSNLVLGQLDDRGLRWNARVVGRFASVDEVGNLPVDDHGLRLRDIAEIRYEEPPIAYGRRLDGAPAVALEVYKESTANTVDVVRAVQRVIHEDIAQDPLLAGVSLFVWEDQAKEITGGIEGLQKAGLVGALLAILCLWFFLRRFDSTFIVSLSIPFSIVAACGLMYFMGKSLNILSMMGLMLGVGMLVDNAIVVLESIDRRHRTEPDPERAALTGAREVVLAVTASTATTLIVFLPLVLGASTDLTTWLREVGITISLALGASLFSSLTLIPLLATRILKRKRSEPVRSIEALERGYERLLRWTLTHQWKTFFLLTVVFVVGILPFPLKLVETAIFSASTNERLRLEYEFDDFHYKSQSRRVIQEVEAYLDHHRADFGLASIYSFYAENEAATILILEHKGLPDREIKALRKRIRDGLPTIPGVRVVFRDDADEGGSSTSFAVKLFGQDTEVLDRLTREAKRRIETVQGVADVSSSLEAGRNEIQVRIDRDKALKLGLTAQDVANIFSFTLGGMRLPRFDAGEREVDTWLALRLEDRENLDDLRKLEIRSADGRPIVLGDIASFEVVQKPATIRRENRKVRVAVYATYEGKSWNDAKQEIEGLMNSLEMPAGYSWSWNDRIIEQEGQGKQMGNNFLLALAFVYLVMAALFESLSLPFAILFSIPFALPGVAWMLALTRTPFNLMSQIGLLILMGIVVNNGIVLLDRMNQLRGEGHSPEEAMALAGRDRMRAILMTATTTIIGLLPLAVGGAEVGGLLYFPMARTLMGGLISSVVLTLVVLPWTALRVEAVALWFRRIWLASEPTGKAAPAIAPAAGEA